jgi:hypothetical protein
VSQYSVDRYAAPARLRGGPPSAGRKRNPRLAEAQSKGVASIKAEADAFALNVKPILMSLGDISAQAKARELNARRVATASGGKWSATTVLRVQRRLEAAP